MIKDNLDELLELTLEMEGLITLMLKRDDMTPPRVTAMLERKTLRFNELLGIDVRRETAVPASAPLQEPELFKEPEPMVPESKTAAPVREEIVPESTCGCQADSDEEKVAESVETEQIEDADDNMPEELPVDSEPAEKVLNDVLSKGMLHFTLNDKFRFKRNLFDNSEEEFEGTIKVISEMSSIDEVNDYLYNDLCLDPEDDEVKAFITVVANHFS